MDIQARQFCLAWQQYVVIGPEPGDPGRLDFELDLCVALDANMTPHENVPGGTRTLVGELEYQAKFCHSQEHARQLGILMARAFAVMPRPDASQPRPALAYVPAPDDKQDHLARSLAQVIHETLPDQAPGFPLPELIDARLPGPKPTFRLLDNAVRRQHWRDVLDRHPVQLSAPVEGRWVYLVDDLYQSGATLRAIAGALRAQGAACVVGVVSASWSGCPFKHLSSQKPLPG